MKKTFFLAGIAALCLNLAASAQESAPESKKYANATVDSITSKYKLVPMPGQLSIEQVFPVIGVYQSNDNTGNKLEVTLDETNKGYVWIDGLEQGRVKAILKRSPGTYKIPAQKTEEGKQVAEGTLYYDADSKQLNVIIGRSFNEADPASVFNAPEESSTAVVKTKAGKTKEKVKKVQPWVFTGSKLEVSTAAN